MATPTNTPTLAQIAAFASFDAANKQFTASYQTPERPAARLEYELAEADLMRVIEGATTQDSGRIIAVYERGDVRTEEDGVRCWGEWELAAPGPPATDPIVTPENQAIVTARALAGRLNDHQRKELARLRDE